MSDAFTVPLFLFISALMTSLQWATRPALSLLDLFPPRRIQTYSSASVFILMRMFIASFSILPLHFFRTKQTVTGSKDIWDAWILLKSFWPWRTLCLSWVTCVERNGKLLNIREKKAQSNELQCWRQKQHHEEYTYSGLELI